MEVEDVLLNIAADEDGEYVVVVEGGKLAYRRTSDMLDSGHKPVGILTREYVISDFRAACGFLRAALRLVEGVEL